MNYYKELMNLFEGRDTVIPKNEGEEILLHFITVAEHEKRVSELLLNLNLQNRMKEALPNILPDAVEGEAEDNFMRELFDRLKLIGDYNVEYDIDGSDSSAPEAIADWIHLKIQEAKESPTPSPVQVVEQEKNKTAKEILGKWNEEFSAKDWEERSLAAMEEYKNQSNEVGEQSVSEKQFCKIYTEFQGEEIDNIKQLTRHYFTGEELLEFINFCLKITKAQEGYSKWISVEDKLPENLETVWISNGKGWTTLGCRSGLQDDGEGSYYWSWAAMTGIIYEEGGRIVAECEDDDLDVQYWQPLPLPPAEKVQEGDASLMPNDLKSGQTDK